MVRKTLRHDEENEPFLQPYKCT